MTQNWTLVEVTNFIWYSFHAFNDTHNKSNLLCLTHSLTHSTEQNPSSPEANGSSTFYGTRRFITVFTRARHMSLSWARAIQFVLHPSYWRSILILYPSMPASSKWSPSLRFPNQNPPLLHTCYMSCQSHQYNNNAYHTYGFQVREVRLRFSRFTPRSLVK